MTLETLLTTQDSNIWRDNTMLINLTRKELDVVIGQLWKSRKSEEKVNQIYEKLRNLDKCCTCQEDGLDYEQDYLTP